MEARILADEHIDARITDVLRRKGHDVSTVRQLNENKAGDGWQDEEVLNEAIRLNRIVLTSNINDFKQLAETITWHCGIVGVVNNPDAVGLAEKIDQFLKDEIRDDPRSMIGKFERIRKE